MNVIHLLCASISVHISCMIKTVSVFPRVNVSATRTSDQRQSNVSGVYLDRGLSLSDINDTQSTHDKRKNNNFSPDCGKRHKCVFNAKVYEQLFTHALNTYSAYKNPRMLMSTIIVFFISLFCTYVTIFNRKKLS